MIRKVFATTVIALFISSAPVLAAETSEVKGAPIAIPAPPEGQGQVVFFRPGGMGLALGCSVNEKSQKVSSLGAGRYFVMVAQPGRHQFTVKSEASDSLALEVEAGETQYAICRIKMGLIVGRPDLAPSTEAAFRKHSKLKLVDGEDMGPGEGALRPDQLAAAILASSKK
jgi:hypothetical protein